MKKIVTVISALTLFLGLSYAGERYVGGDVSLLPEYESAGAKYKDYKGKEIPDLLVWCREQGMNAMRVRLFVDPSKYTGSDADPNACQDLEYIIPLCKRIVDDGYALMLDFHYSDTWADPAKQYTPADWKGLDDEALCEAINEYTAYCLTVLKSEGVVPAFIQPGNEISYGMLWGPEGTSSSNLKKALMGSSANWERFGMLLNSAVSACREVCPDAKIVIHTERVAQVNVQRNFYQMMDKLGVDYDIVGLSYYPYFHGALSVLDKALTEIEEDFPDKEIMIVETGYPYKWEVPGTTYDNTDDYPYTDAGQAKFASELVSTLEAHPMVNGLFWWWFEYNAYNTGLSGWYNAPLFDSQTGRATSALEIICSFADESGIAETERDPNLGGEAEAVYYDLNGLRTATPGGGVFILKQGEKSKKVIIGN